MSPEAHARGGGAALLTALLIVAVAAALATSLMSAQHLEIRASANLLDRDRGMWFALGGEAWAMGILNRDAADSQYDHLNEIWAGTPPPVPVTGGSATGRIIDLHGRFNLNNLLVDGKQSPNDWARFERLLKVVGIEPRVAFAVMDWIDPDSVVSGPGGAEEETYLGRRPPYRPANRFFTSTSELRLVAGFDEEKVTRLLPFVTALPERTEININTAPLELLMTLVENMSRAEAQVFDDKRRRENGYKSVNALLEEPYLKGKGVLSAGLTVNSRFFLVESAVTLGRGRTFLSSVLLRGGSHTKVLRRTREGG
ncbi:MAG: type II secretion system minor pseudopilin GspK [Magnetococcales bacterium]|nr:type II secretion system minor pseudopilin GspK [Magnetococcales bacterium]MBF0262558.1 type II secretion system minor pseudopilin GspK [Magnetococcales bacterium]